MATSLASTSPRSGLFFFGAVAAALPIVAQLFVFARATMNVPSGDDFASILPFACDWAQATSFLEKYRLLTAQFYSHRIVFTRVFTVVDVWIFGECNLVALQVAGWLGWLVTVVGLVTASPAVRRTPWLALPATLLLCHPQGYTNALCAIGMGNFWVVAFAFCAIGCAMLPRWPALALSITFATLAASAFANGLLAFPVLVLAFLVQRRYRYAAGLCVAGALVWLLYLHGYHSPGQPISLMELFRKMSVMAGGLFIVSRVPNPVALWGGGAIIVTAGILLCRPAFWRTLPVFASFISFILATLLMGAAGRQGWDDYYMVQDRYRLYGLLLLAIFYLTAIESSPRRFSLFAYAGTGALIYCLFAYANTLSTVFSGRRWQEATVQNHQFGQCFPHAIPSTWPEDCAVLERAEKTGVFRLGPAFGDADQKFLEKLAQVTPENPSRFEPRHDDPLQGYFLIPPAESTNAAQLAAPEFAVLFNRGRRVILPVNIFRPRLADSLRHASLLGRKFGIVLPSPLNIQGPCSLFGIIRDGRGNLAVSFAGSVQVP